MKKAFYVSLLITLLSVILSISYKSFALRIIDKELLAHFLSALDIVGAMSLLLLGFRSAMAVSLSEGGDEHAMMAVLGRSVVIVMGLGVILVVPITHTLFPSLSWQGLMAILTVTGLYIYATNPLSMKRLYPTMNIIAFLEPCIGFVVIVGLSLAGITGETLLVLSTLISLGSVSFIALHALAKHHTPLWGWSITSPVNRFYKRALLASMEFALGLIVVYGAVIVYISFFPHYLGDFQVVAKTLYMGGVTLFVFPLFKFVMPELSFSRDNQEMIHRWFIKYWVIISLCALAVAYYAQPIVNMFFDRSLSLAPLMTQWLMGALILTAFNGYMVAYFRSQGFFGISVMARLVGVIIFFISFGLLFTPLGVVQAFFCNHLSITLIFLGFISMKHYKNKHNE